MFYFSPEIGMQARSNVEILMRFCVTSTDFTLGSHIAHWFSVLFSPAFRVLHISLKE